MTWDFLRSLRCEQLWAIKMRHVDDVQGRAHPEYYLRPLGCRCPR